MQRFMGNYIKLLLGVVLTTCTAFSGQEDDFLYRVVDGEATVYGLARNLGRRVVIPDHLGNAPVVAIDGGWYLSSEETFDLIIPTTVKRVNLLKNLGHVSSVFAEGNLETIVDDCFSGCSSITSLVVSGSVKHIGTRAFYNCPQLSRFEISEGVLNVGEMAFQGCVRLRQLSFASLQTLGGSAFCGCASLREVDLFNTSLVEIPGAAFADCRQLRKIILPQTLETIGCSAFDQCVSLECVGSTPDAQIAGKVYNMPLLRDIGDRAFRGCQSLYSVQLDDSVTHVGVDAFSGCPDLGVFEVGSSVTNLECLGFSNTGLSSIAVHPENERYSSVDGVLYDKDGTTLLRCPPMLRTLVVPATVTRIADRAFDGCKSLSTVYFPGDAPSCSEEIYHETSPLIATFARRGTKGWGDDGMALWRNRPIFRHDESGARDLADFPSRIDALGQAEYVCSGVGWLAFECRTPQAGKNGQTLLITSSPYAQSPGCASVSENALTSDWLETRVKILGSRVLQLDAPGGAEFRNVRFETPENLVEATAWRIRFTGSGIENNSWAERNEDVVWDCTDSCLRFYCSGDYGYRLEVDLPELSPIDSVSVCSDWWNSSELTTIESPGKEQAIWGLGGQWSPSAIMFSYLDPFPYYPRYEMSVSSPFLNVPFPSYTIEPVWFPCDSYGEEIGLFRYDLGEYGHLYSLPWGTSFGGVLSSYENGSYSDKVVNEVRPSIWRENMPPEDVVEGAITTDEGWIFIGWNLFYDPLDVTHIWRMDEIRATFVAQYRPQRINVVYEDEFNRENPNPSCFEGTVGPLLPIEDREPGYVFSGWTVTTGQVYWVECVEDEGVCDFPSKQGYLHHGDVTARANWLAITNRIEVLSPHGGSAGIHEVRYGTELLLRAPADVIEGGTNYVCVGSSMFLPLTNAVVITAEKDIRLTWDVWKTNYLMSITENTNGWHGTVECADGTLGCYHEKDSVCVLEARPETGYRFAGWEGDVPGDCMENPKTFVMDQSRKVWPTFEKRIIDPPVILPTSGSVFLNSLTVTITNRMDGATIHYTTDGSEPTMESPVYKRFRISGKTTVKARAFYEDGAGSEVVTAEYALGRCDDPALSLADGTVFHQSNQPVSIAQNGDEGVLRYTLDGTEPTAESPVYAGPFMISESTVVKAKVFSDRFFDSQVVTANLTRERAKVETPVITAAESFTGSKTKVVIACATEGATIHYTTDGSEPDSSSTTYTGPFEVTASCTIKACAVLDDYTNSEIAIRNIEKIWGIGDSLGEPDQYFTTAGDAGWMRDTVVSQDGAESMRSGAITDSQTSVLSTVVNGKGSVSFWWKTSCEEDRDFHDWDHVVFAVDGVEIARLDGITDWRQVSCELTTDGDHAITWTYLKDEFESDGADCAWVDAFVWSPMPTIEETQTTDVPVPFAWLRAKYPELTDAAAFETKANEMAANGVDKVWECYVSGVDPTDAAVRFSAQIEMVDGQPVVTPSPDLKDERVYKVLGKTSLEDVGEWQYPTKPEHRFFKVTVEMP